MVCFIDIYFTIDRNGTATENTDPTGSIWARSIKTGKASEKHVLDKKVLD